VGRLLLLAAIVVLAWKLFTGRWPWEAKPNHAAVALKGARKLLGVSASASREEILGAHKRRLAMIHPDRGGSNELVHAANAARDLLLAQVTYDPEDKR
jgi:hypothetical protein